MDATAKTKAGEAPAVKVSPTHSLQKLRDTIEQLDCFAQETLSQVESVARLALRLLEQPEGYLHPDDIANALELIVSHSSSCMDRINSEAGRVDCAYVDEAQMRRYDARQAARAQGEEIARRSAGG